LFHGAYRVDVNNDGIKDLIVCPSETDGGNNIEHIWCYINKGSDCAPIFELKTKSFLIETMVSVGGRSDATTADLNGDGLKDLIVGSNGLKIGFHDRVDRLYYYKNTGTKTSPEFTLENDDFLEMDDKTEFPGSLSPCAGDMDGDDDVDLIIGDSNGELYFFENKNGPNNPISFTSIAFPYEDIFIGPTAKPYMYDVNKDGLNDLIIGEQNNFLNYYKNIGTKGHADFKDTADDEDYGKIFKGNDGYLWFGSPCVFDADDGKTYMFMGFTTGAIALYEKTNVNGEDVYIRLDSFYQDREFGLKATPDIVDIDEDGYYDLIVGNQGGGLQFYHTEFKVPTTSVKSLSNIRFLQVLPNPVMGNLKINAKQRGIAFLYNIVGELILETKIESNENIDVSHIDGGAYLLKLITENGEIYLTKFVKI
jgi:hypothetical protein